MINRKTIVTALVATCIVGTAWWAGVRSQSVDDDVVAPPMEQAKQIYLDREPPEPFAEQPVVTTHYTAEHPAVGHPVLRWSRIDGAVMYDVQILTKEQLLNSDGSLPRNITNQSCRFSVSIRTAANWPCLKALQAMSSIGASAVWASKDKQSVNFLL